MSTCRESIILNVLRSIISFNNSNSRINASKKLTLKMTTTKNKIIIILIKNQIFKVVENIKVKMKCNSRIWLSNIQIFREVIKRTEEFSLLKTNLLLPLLNLLHYRDRFYLLLLFRIIPNKNLHVKTNHTSEEKLIKIHPFILFSFISN